MKNIRIYLLIVVVLTMFGSAVWFSPAQASEQIAGNEVVVKDRVVEEDLLAAGGNVQVQSEIKGDLTAAGGDVNITGPVAGYVMAAGGNVAVAGSVGSDLWAAGGNVSVSGPVGDNAMLAGGNVELKPEASVRRDASIAGGNVTVQGKIERNLKLAAGEARISSEVGGSVEANVDRLTVSPGAVIRGNLVVHGSQAPEISPEAQVLGQVEFRQREQRSPWLSLLWWWLFTFLALLFVGFAVLLLSNIWPARVTTMITGKPMFSLLAGLLGVILTPIIIVLLLATVVGIPLALILLAFYTVLMLLSGVFVAYLIGGWLLGLMKRPEASPWLRMIIGVLVVSFMVSLPWVGGLATLAVLLIGFGALVLERWDIRQQLRREGLA